MSAYTGSGFLNNSSETPTVTALKDGTDPADVADVAWRIMARIEGG